MTSNNIQPTDDLLNELNEPRADRTWTIAGLTTEYPWESDEQYEQFLNAANRTTLTPENRHSLTEKIREISDRRHNLFWQNNTQEKNDVTDAILRATGLYEEHETYNENSIHADVSSIRNGITVQQWLNALKAFDKLNVDDYSDGHIVNYWYGMETDQVVIHINHKHWLENDKTAYIRMTAYEQIESERPRTERTDRICNRNLAMDVNQKKPADHGLRKIQEQPHDDHNENKHTSP